MSRARRRVTGMVILLAVLGGVAWWRAGFVAPDAGISGLGSRVASPVSLDSVLAARDGEIGLIWIPSESLAKLEERTGSAEGLWVQPDGGHASRVFPSDELRSLIADLELGAGTVQPDGAIHFVTGGLLGGTEWRGRAVRTSMVVDCSLELRKRKPDDPYLLKTFVTVFRGYGVIVRDSAGAEDGALLVFAGDGR